MLDKSYIAVKARHLLRYNRSRKILIACILIAGGAIRAALLSSKGFEHDMLIFRIWSLAAAEEGFKALGNTIKCNYMPIYTQILWFMGILFQKLQHTFSCGETVLDVLIKIPSNIADLGMSCILYFYFMKHLKVRLALFALAFFWLNPAMIYNSAYWGQGDSIVGLFTVLALLALADRHIAIAFFFLGLGIMTKLQAIILMPIFAGYALYFEGLAVSTYSRKLKIRSYSILVLSSVSTLAVSVFIVNLPFILAGNGGHIYRVITGAVGFFEMVSLNAHNFWWIAMGTNATSTWDGYLILDLLTYRNIGLLIFCGVAGASTLISLKPFVWLKRDIAPFSIAFFLAFSFYMLPTQMHERYILYCLPIIALAVRDENELWPVYIILSIGTFVSLASTLHLMYQNSMPLIAFLFPPGREEVYVVSIINAVLWMWLIILFVKSLDKLLILSCIAIAPLVLAISFSGIMNIGRGIPLSEIKPEYVYQELGVIQRNRSFEKHKLSVGGHEFDKGLGTHAKSIITYDIKGKYKRFETAMGIDDESVKNNLVNFIIVGDDSILFDSGPIGFRPFPVTCAVSVEDVDKLQLIVESGGDGIDHDHADWIEPRLFRFNEIIIW